MAETDITKTTTTSMKSTVTDYSVAAQALDSAQITESTYTWTNFKKYLGYYKAIPELKQSINALADWSVGKGYTADTQTNIMLERITGWGEDTFKSILWNLLVMKKINGDALAEIVRDEKNGNLLNLKPLDPSTMKVIVSKEGIILRYEEITTGKKFKPEKILHLCNDRVGNEIHGSSVIEACQWVIDARNESMADWRRTLHRSTIRIIEVDSDDTASYSTLKTQWATAIKNGEVMILPKDNFTFPDAPINYIDPQQWIKYLEDFFYQAVGVPKVILGGSSEFTEASSKIAYVTFEQIYTKEQTEFEADLWNQVGIKITFNKPVSLKSEAITAEDKNTGQVGFQPNDTQLNSGKTAITQPNA